MYRRYDTLKQNATEEDAYWWGFKAFFVINKILKIIYQSRRRKASYNVCIYLLKMIGLLLQSIFSLMISLLIIFIDIFISLLKNAYIYVPIILVPIYAWLHLVGPTLSLTHFITKALSLFALTAANLLPTSFRRRCIYILTLHFSSLPLHMRIWKILSRLVIYPAPALIRAGYYHLPHRFHGDIYLRDGISLKMLAANITSSMLPHAPTAGAYTIIFAITDI